MKTISKLPNLEFANLQIGDSWFDYDNQGDNFILDEQEIYVETSVSDFDPVEYFAAEEEGSEEELSDGSLLKPILSKCDLEITFSCHLLVEIKIISYFLSILTEIFPDSVLTNHYEGENFAGKDIDQEIQKIQKEFEDE